MKLIVLDERERERLNDFVASSPFAHFKQLYEWGEILEYEGTRTVRLAVERNGVLCASVAIYVRRLPGSAHTFLSGSRGPILDFADPRPLACLLQGVSEIARDHRAIFLRLDPDVSDESQEVRDALGASGLLHLREKNWSSLSDPRVVMSIDLEAPESELFSRMRVSHRRNIRAIARKGIHLRDAVDENDVARFHRIWSQVGERKGFPVRSLDYYRRLWTLFVQQGRGHLWLAEKDDDTLAALLEIVVGRKSWILHSGSTTAARKLKPNEAMWWEAMMWAKRHGAKWCDFGGTGTDWPPEEDSPGYSLYSFKRGFRAEAVCLSGYHDLVFKPRLYRLFRLAEEQLLPHAVTAVNLVGRLTRA